MQMYKEQIEAVIKELEQEINTINKDNGWKVCVPEDWEQEYKIPAIIALIQSEASEALEGFRNGDKENFVEELADVIIRVLDCTAGLEVDITTALLAKLEKNRQRGFRHGGKRV